MKSALFRAFRKNDALGMSFGFGVDQVEVCFHYSTIALMASLAFSMSSAVSTTLSLVSTTLSLTLLTEVLASSTAWQALNVARIRRRGRKRLKKRPAMSSSSLPPRRIKLYASVGRDSFPCISSFLSAFGGFIFPYY